MSNRVARRRLLGAALLGLLLLATPLAAADEPHPWTAAQPEVPADANDLPNYVVRPIRRGSEVEFLGEIDYGAAEDLRRVLAANPSAKVLHLNSPGGEVPEARQMAQIVRGRGLITTVDKLCLSACPLVFLAGNQRYSAPGAKIGFHRFWSPGMSAAEMDSIDQIDRDFMQKAGLPVAFIDKAFSTPSSSIWIPTNDELKAAAVISGVSSKYLITVGAYRSYVGERAEAIQQVLEGIKKRYPDRYAAIHKGLLQSTKSYNSDVEAPPGINSSYADILAKFIPHSSDRLALAFLQAFVRMLEDLAKHDPDACFYSLVRTKAPPGFKSAWNMPLVEAQQINLAMLKAAADGAQRYAPVPSSADVAKSWQLYVQEFPVKHPEDVPILADIDSPAHGHVAVCLAELHAFSMILLLPHAQQGPLARYIFAEGSDEDSSRDNASTTPTHTELPRPFGIHPDK